MKRRTRPRDTSPLDARRITILADGHPTRHPLERTERSPCRTQQSRDQWRRPRFLISDALRLNLRGRLFAHSNMWPSLYKARLGNPRAFGLRVSHADLRYFMPAFSTRIAPPSLTTRLPGYRALCYPDSNGVQSPFQSATSSEVDLSSVYFRRKNSPRMRCYALTFWWMLPVLQIRRHGVLTSFALSQHLGSLNLRLGCCPLDNGTWLPMSDYSWEEWMGWIPSTLNDVLPRSEFHES